MHALNRMKLHYKESGVGLIEVMIAFLILSIGVLGAASMMINSTRSTNSAYYRALATDIATELSDRMRANLPAMDLDDSNAATNSGAYQVARDSFPNCGTSKPAAVCAMSPDDGVSDLSTNGCTPAQMAAYDLWQMACVNGTNSLPSGTFAISCQSQVINGTNESCGARKIDVFWQSNDDAAEQSVTVLFLPGPLKAAAR